MVNTSLLLATTAMGDLKEQFESAVNYVQNGPSISDITNEIKLKFYALYKQATSGPNKEKQPSRLNIVARMKWEAWNKLGKMSKEEAMKRYIEQLEKLVPNWKEWKNTTPKSKL